MVLASPSFFEFTLLAEFGRMSYVPARLIFLGDKRPAYISYKFEGSGIRAEIGGAKSCVSLDESPTFV